MRSLSHFALVVARGNGPVSPARPRSESLPGRKRRGLMQLAGAQRRHQLLRRAARRAGLVRRESELVHGLATLGGLQGFGRRAMVLEPSEAEDLVLYQIAAVAGLARAEGLTLAHVKPHGALYNQATRERGLAEAIARAVHAFDAGLALFAPPHSALSAAGRALGLRVVHEGFADRAYQPDGSLVPRRQPGAVIANVEEVVTRAMQMATERTVMAVDGSVIQLDIDTLCVHGDTPGAASMAAWLRAGLTAAGVDVKAPGA